VCVLAGPLVLITGLDNCFQHVMLEP
jgi:hypothetical protein